MSLLRSIATIGGLTMVSRVFGFVRDTLMAALLGAGPVADAFFVALRFPNLFRSLFAEGAFSAAFVPIFVGTLASDGRAAAIAFAERTLSVLTTALLAFILAGRDLYAGVHHPSGTRLRGHRGVRTSRSSSRG